MLSVNSIEEFAVRQPKEDSVFLVGCVDYMIYGVGYLRRRRILSDKGRRMGSTTLYPFADFFNRIRHCSCVWFVYSESNSTDMNVEISQREE